LDQDYSAIIAAQTLVLALFPVALYFLGKKLHSPAAGVTVALFAIFRELVTLWISSNTRVANSKIFTTDFPNCTGHCADVPRRHLVAGAAGFASTLVAGGALGLLPALPHPIHADAAFPVLLLALW
jgi:hypothetical protein